MASRLQVRMAVLGFLFAVFAVAASAQQTIKCESNNGGRNYCGSVPSDRVALDRQISGSPCVRDRSWGVDNRGLWVDHGCRATFVVAYNGRPGGNNGYPPPPPSQGPGYPSGGWQLSVPRETHGPPAATGTAETGAAVVRVIKTAISAATTSVSAAAKAIPPSV